MRLARRFSISSRVAPSFSRARRRSSARTGYQLRREASPSPMTSKGATTSRILCSRMRASARKAPARSTRGNRARSAGCRPTETLRRARGVRGGGPPPRNSRPQSRGRKAGERREFVEARIQGRHEKRGAVGLGERRRGSRARSSANAGVPQERSSAEASRSRPRRVSGKPVERIGSTNAAAREAGASLLRRPPGFEMEASRDG